MLHSYTCTNKLEFNPSRTGTKCYFVKQKIEVSVQTYFSNYPISIHKRHKRTLIYLCMQILIIKKQYQMANLYILLSSVYKHDFCVHKLIMHWIYKLFLWSSKCYYSSSSHIVCSW